MQFRLVRYFTVASLGMFAIVAAALIYFENQQGAFFKEVEDESLAFFSNTQQEFARQQEAAALRDLLRIHESGNVNLTRLFANALWARDFAPFVARAQAIDVAPCRAMADIAGADGKPVEPPAKKACFAEAGQQIMSLKGFKDLDAKVFDTMKKSTVFKIKVFDLRGVTIYSSEHNQIGEDKSGNAGWQGAIAGTPTSELTHRDKFSAFEGVVENRDLISSYLPVLEPGSSRIVGVFEVYSDVTPFLNQIKETSGKLHKVAMDNQRRIESEAVQHQDKVDSSSTLQLAAVVVLLGLLFSALYAIVRRAESIIKTQERDRQHAQQQLAQHEKMASLGQMVAGVAHQLNTPLAFSQSNVLMVKDALQTMEFPMQLASRMSSILKEVDGNEVTLKVEKIRARLGQLDEGDVDVGMLQQMLSDVLEGIGQMSELVVNLRDFTRLDRSTTSDADLNRSLHTVVYIAKSVISNAIEVVEEYGELPPVECNPSQLNQVFLNLLNNAAQSIDGSGKITVRSTSDGDHVRISVTDTGRGIAPDVLPRIFDLYFTTKPNGEGTGLGLAIAKDIVDQHGGIIDVDTAVDAGSTFTVTLPVRQAALAKAA